MFKFMFFQMTKCNSQSCKIFNLKRVIDVVDTNWHGSNRA